MDPVRRVTLTQAVTERMLSLLKAGKFRPGDRFPSETKLAAQLSVGRSSVREAMRALLTLGILEVKPGIGYFVAQTINSHMPAPAAVPVLAERASRRFFIEARGILEVEMAALAAERATADDLAEMERAVAQSDESLKAGQYNSQASRSFHLAIASATHNPMLVEIRQFMMDTLGQRMIDSSSYLRTLAEEDCIWHRRIYQAIRSGDVMEARRQMRGHLASNLADWEEILSQELSSVERQETPVTS